jgi:hypothetical protein
MKFDISGISVMIILPAKGSISIPTVRSLIETADMLRSRGISYEMEFQVDGNIEYARSKGAHRFLQSKCNRLFWIDSDMEWKSENVLRLLALSTKMDVVGGVYCARREPATFFMQFPSTEGVHESNEWGCLPCNGFGIGFTVVSRTAVQALADVTPKIMFGLDNEPMAHLFACDVNDGSFVGEDMAFFARLRKIGYQPYFDPSLTLGHVGEKVYSASIQDHLQQVQRDVAA